MNFRPTQVKWQLMVASCYRRSGRKIVLTNLTHLAKNVILKSHYSCFYVFRKLSESTWDLQGHSSEISRKRWMYISEFLFLYTDLWPSSISSSHVFVCWAGLRFLVRLCTDMGLKEVQDYATKLKKVEKMKEIREQVLCSLLVLLKCWLFWIPQMEENSQ